MARVAAAAAAWLLGGALAGATSVEAHQFGPGAARRRPAPGGHARGLSTAALRQASPPAAEDVVERRRHRRPLMRSEMRAEAASLAEAPGEAVSVETGPEASPAPVAGGLAQQPRVPQDARRLVGGRGSEVDPGPDLDSAYDDGGDDDDGEDDRTTEAGDKAKYDDDDGEDDSGSAGAGESAGADAPAGAAGPAGADDSEDEDVDVETTGGVDQDCTYGEWSDWGECSKKCSSGRSHGWRNRTRGIIASARGRGNICHQGDFQRQPCNLLQCEVDCKWESWSDWTGCQCDSLVQKRTRALVSYAHGGVNVTCDPGDGFETRECSLRMCPRNCEWSDWGGWTDCSKECGTGTHFRTRNKTREAEYGGQACTGLPREDSECNAAPCDVDCVWSEWSVSDCGASCGGGVRTRNRTVAEEQAGNGAECAGASSVTEACNEQPCPVDCLWGNWEDWGACSKTCRVGSRNRTRGVLEASHDGGAECKREDGVQFMNCSENVPCPIDCYWNDWSDWTPCSVFCGEGVRTRGRSYIQEQHGGQPCDATDASQLEACVGPGEGDDCPTEPPHPRQPLAASALMEDDVLGTLRLEVAESAGQRFADYCGSVMPSPGSTAPRRPTCSLRSAIADGIRSAVAHWQAEQGLDSDAMKARFLVEVSVIEAEAPAGASDDASLAAAVAAGDAAGVPGALADGARAGSALQRRGERKEREERGVSVHFDIREPPAGVGEVLWTVGTGRMRDELNTALGRHSLDTLFHIKRVVDISQRSREVNVVVHGS